MNRFGKRFTYQQMVYRAVTFDDGYNDKHNAAIRVKLVNALMDAETIQVRVGGAYQNYYSINLLKLTQTLAWMCELF